MKKIIFQRLKVEELRNVQAGLAQDDGGGSCPTPSSTQGACLCSTQAVIACLLSELPEKTAN